MKNKDEELQPYRPASVQSGRVNRRPLSIILPDDLFAGLVKATHKQKLTMSKVVRLALRIFLEKEGIL